MANEIKDLINAQHDYYDPAWVTDAVILAIDEIELLTDASYSEGDDSEIDKIASDIGVNYLTNRGNRAIAEQNRQQFIPIANVPKRIIEKFAKTGAIVSEFAWNNDLPTEKVYY